MTADSLDIHLFQESPSRQWVLQLRKMGGHLTIARAVAEQFDQQKARALELATFLKVPLAIETEAK